MGINVRCDNCGKLVEIDPATGRLRRARCPACGARLSLPAGLADLPTPHIPASAMPAPAARPSGPPAEPAYADQHAEGSLAHAAARPVMAALAGVMPWLLSLCLHAGALLILLSFVIIIQPPHRGADRENGPPTAPDSTFTEELPVNMLKPLTPPSPGKDGESLTIGAQREGKTILPAGADRGWALLSTGQKTIGQGWGLGTESGKMPVYGGGRNGGGGAGGKNPFGLTRGGGTGDVAFLGSGTGTDTIAGGTWFVIFVIDKSGSVVGAFDDIRTQLMDSICHLAETQQFHVIFFSGDKCEQLPPGRLVPASAENKRAALKGLAAVQASGFGSSPIPALEVAFRAFRSTPPNKGKVLFLLTDGEFDSSGYEYRERGGKPLMGNQAVTHWLRDNNKSQNVHVYPIILGPPPSADTKASVESMAEENGGR